MDNYFKDSLYSLLFNMTDLVLKYYDPCQNANNGCLVNREKNPCCISGTVFSNPRSGPCPYLNDGECGHPNVSCKIWLCETAMKNVDPACVELLKNIERIAIQFGWMDKPYLGEPYKGGSDNP